MRLSMLIENSHGRFTKFLKFSKSYLFIALILTVNACETITPKNQTEEFGKLAQSFITEYFQFFPDETPLSIDNENLSKLAIPTVGYLDSVRQFQQHFTAELTRFDRNVVHPTVLRDILRMEKVLKNVEVYLSDCTVNPQRFNVLHGFKRILHADYASDEYRFQTLFNKMAAVPHYYEIAKSQLKQVNPDAADAAVEQHVQTLLFFEKNIEKTLTERRQMTPQYQARLTATKLAIKDFAAFVESFRVQ